MGCLGWALVLLIGGGTLFGGCLAVGAAFLIGGETEDGPTSGDRGSGKGDESRDRTDAGAAGKQDGGAAIAVKPDAGPAVSTATAKGGTVVTLAGRDVETEAAFSKGACDDRSSERSRNVYQATRGGSARRLRGRIAALQIRLGTRSASWTPRGEIRVEHASLAAARFLTDEAKRHQVTGLRYEVIPWTLVSPYQLPVLTLQPNHTLSQATLEEVERGSRQAVEAALGMTLAQMTKELRAKGYDEVAFLIYFPAESKVRDWARPSGGSRAELGYIFSPLTTAFGDFSWVISHESMHLFGADDLYRVQNVDEDDKGDIMNAYCTGFARAHIGEASSFAVGWRPARPARRFVFEEL